MSSRDNRTLIAIGGREDKCNGSEVLRELVRHVGNGKLVVMTVATEDPEGMFAEYREVFERLGVERLEHLKIEHREQAKDPAKVEVLRDAKGIFFTGGDQLRISSQIGDTPVFQTIQRLYRQGAVVAGTSSGAAVLCETMITDGEDDRSHQQGSLLRMAPGLGLVHGLIIDMHFAERGRMGRLLGAVAQNPRIVGVGIDENTAVVIRNESMFKVLGESAVYVVDGQSVTDSNISKDREEDTLSIYDVTLHLLSEGHAFDLEARRPLHEANGR